MREPVTSLVTPGSCAIAGHSHGAHSAAADATSIPQVSMVAHTSGGAALGLAQFDCIYHPAPPWSCTDRSSRRSSGKVPSRLRPAQALGAQAVRTLSVVPARAHRGAPAEVSAVKIGFA
jgi:hypothetical protein